MRYRIYFEALQPIEVEAADIRIIDARRIECVPGNNFNATAFSVDLYFPCEIDRIADDHGRYIYRR